MRPQDEELTRLLNESFIPVRLVNVKDVDLNFFQFDYDLTFAILMMNANGHVYSRFGTMDGSGTTNRMSVAGLKRAMKTVGTLHKVDAGLTPVKRPPLVLTDIPAFARSRQAKEECYHCHYVGAFPFKQLRAEGKFQKAMVFQYPLPENLGLSLEVDRNNVIQSVQPGSPADRAGLQSGDGLLWIEGFGDSADASGKSVHRVLTSADLQYALNRLANGGTLDLVIARGTQHGLRKPLRLPASADWRQTDVSWRSSQATFAPTVGIWGMALSAEEKTQRQLAADRMALKVTFFFNGPEWVPTRGDLKLNDVIVGINGQAQPHMTIRQFHTYFRLNFNVGDSVTLNVLRGGQKLDVKVQCTRAGDGDMV